MEGLAALTRYSLAGKANLFNPDGAARF